MSSNDIVGLTSLSNDIDLVGLTSLSNDIDLVGKTYVNSNYVDNFNEKLIKVLEEGLKEISDSLYSIEVTIENKLLLKD